jgi:hypothetical protein
MESHGSPATAPNFENERGKAFLRGVNLAISGVVVLLSTWMSIQISYSAPL